MRWQGKVKAPQRAPRGRGYAVDTLGFARPEVRYVVVEKGLLDGGLNPAEVLTILYLRHRGQLGAAPCEVVPLVRTESPLG